MTKRIVRDLPATQSAAVWFEEAFPGGLRAYKKMNPLYDVDIKAAEAMARKRPASRTAEIERKVHRIMAKSKVVTVKKRKPSAKAIDAAISAASQGCHVDVKTIAKGLGFQANVPTGSSLTKEPTLDERIRALLTDHPLDAVLCGLARVHEVGAVGEWNNHTHVYIPHVRTFDALALRECVGKLSVEGGKVLKAGVSK